METMETLALSQFAEFLKNPRPRDSHKGRFGHVLIVGGDVGFSGAVRLAAEAALRVGAGLVSVVTQPEHAKTLNLTCPEIMCHGDDHFLDLAEKASVMVLGPGLGQSTWSRALFFSAIDMQKPMIIDADGLNLLAQHPSKNSGWILTPHPGEAARLLNTITAEIQANRISSIQRVQDAFGGTIVLKGAGTLILSDNKMLSICTAGNPGMATAGMGDVLSGVIGGLLAQQLDPDVAAQLGVLLHATAGDLAAKSDGERGMIASDLLPHLHHLVNGIVE